MSDSNIKADGKTIAEYLTRKNNQLFVIPEYQRRYSWTIEQSNKQLQSISSYIEFHKDNENAEPYFLGTIIADYSDTKVRKGDAKYDGIRLIDGQQRTTTFLLLLKALRLRLVECLKCFNGSAASSGLKDGLEEWCKIAMFILYRAEAKTWREFYDNPEKARGIKILESLSIGEQEDSRNDFQIINYTK